MTDRPALHALRKVVVALSPPVADRIFNHPELPFTAPHNRIDDVVARVDAETELWEGRRAAQGAGT